MSYTKKNLREVEDSAAKHGLSDTQEARFLREDLGSEQTGANYLTVKPSRREAFAHRHNQAEEMYVVLGGSGRVKLDDDIVELAKLDAVRVGPGVTRRFEADAGGLEVLVFGARVEGDGEIVREFWEG
jgi:mannose-6-phosphate isomerase-like protein (cupin superfamily)